MDLVDSDDNVKQLFETICELWKQYKSAPNRYKGPYTSFFQGSGCGKTRSVLELVKHLKLCYLCCRAEDSESQPVRSKVVLDALYGAIKESASMDIIKTIQLFLLACLEVVAERVRDQEQGDREAAEQMGREQVQTGNGFGNGFMNGGSHISSHRTNLFISEKDWKPILERFQHYRLERVWTQPILERINQYAGSTPLLLVFDEAGDLVKHEVLEVSYFRWIRRALAGCNSVFLIFMDTMSRISYFSPSQRTDPSLRVGFGVRPGASFELQKYVHLGIHGE